MTARQGESAQTMVEGCPFPGICRMAAIAARSVLTVMMIITGMTGVTILWSSFEDPANMAACTRRIDMGSGQFERCCIVIEDRSLPSGSGVTGAALFAKLPKVLIVSAMTGETTFGGSAISAGRVTGLASRIDMSSVQLEVGEVVIKLGRLPRVGGMTGGAIFAKAPFMRFIFLMTGITRLRCAFEYTILMTGLASHNGMRSGQCEREA